MYVKADLKEGTKPGVDEQSGTVLKIAWSNGNLLDGEVTSTQASAIVTRCGVDVTEEYAATAFAWKRDSGNAEADATWNAAHAGMKTISLSEADLNGDVKITCTLTGNGPSYGSIAVDEDMDATHTRGTLDANDTFQIVNGELKVTTSRGNVYALEDGKVKGAGAKLNGSITAETKLFASQPEDVVEFSYDHNKLRLQKKVTQSDGETEVTEYMFHGKLLMHLRRGNDMLHFCYDKQKRPILLKMDGSVYSYIHNFQGDIVGIVDGGGSLVVEYKYDAWGKPTLVRTLTTAYEALAELNPFRYRGYMYDADTDMYDLRNRMYDPARSRFLSPDVMVASGRSSRDSNVYAYCGCGPVGNIDIDGNWWLETCIDWVSDNIIEPVVEGVEGVVNSAKEAISNIDFTFSVGININVSVGIWAFNLQGGLSFDSKGNIAVQGSFTGGATTSGEISASAVVYRMLTNAPTIYHLEDLSYQVGGSVSGLPLFGLPIGTLGAELNIIPNTEGGFYKGITWSGGVGVRITEDGFAPSTGVELHAEWGNTKTLAVLRSGSTHLTPEIIPSIERARISAIIERLKAAPLPL